MAGCVWYLQTLAAHPKMRGKGYGGRLLRSICRIGDFYKKCVYLETESLNNEALYQKYGFQTIEIVTLCENQKEKETQPFIMYCMLRKPSNDA